MSGNNGEYFTVTENYLESHAKLPQMQSRVDEMRLQLCDAHQRHDDANTDFTDLKAEIRVLQNSIDAIKEL